MLTAYPAVTAGEQPAKRLRFLLACALPQSIAGMPP